MQEFDEVLSFVDSLSLEASSLTSCERTSCESKEFHWEFGIQQIDRLGLLVSEVTLMPRKPRVAPILRWSEMIIQRLTYLEEGFKLVEHDSEHDSTSLRSKIRQHREESATYYEILLTTVGGISLRHYRLNRDSGERRVCAGNLSRQTFERIIEDLLLVASST